MSNAFEVADGFIDNLTVRKGIMISGQNCMKIIDLMFIDHTDEHRLFCAGLGTHSMNFCAAMMKCVRDIPDQCFFMGCDNGKFIGSFRTFQQLISHKGGNKAIENAEGSRFVVHGSVGVYQDRDCRDNPVKGKGHNKKIGIRSDLVDESGYDIGSAGRRIAAEANTIDHTA